MSEQTKAAVKSDALPANEVKRLSSRSETQKVYSNAYVEIEMRSTGLAQGKRNPSEDQGMRVAQEDAKTLPHVWKWERPIALSAIERNIQNNPAYEREIKRQMPEISQEIVNQKGSPTMGKEGVPSPGAKETPAERWTKSAVEHHQAGRKEDAEIAAYEAGRYGGAVPKVLADIKHLGERFKRGDADALSDQKANSRADALSASGFDPSKEASRTNSTGGVMAQREASKLTVNNPYQEGKRQVQQGSVPVKNESQASNANSQKKGRSL